MVKTKIVWGPPGAGKTTYVNENKGENDLIFDFDFLMAALSGRAVYDHNDNLIYYLVGFRDLIIEKLNKDFKLDTAWLIVSYPSETLKQRLTILEPEYLFMDTPKEVCEERIAERGEEWLEVLEKWFEKHEGGENNLKSFWAFKNKGGSTGQLDIYGPISEVSWFEDEVTPKRFKQDLDELGDITTLEVYINSPGGDVFAGIAIGSMLKRHLAKVVVHIDGIAASIASVVAMAGDEIIMPSNAMMMIHKPSVFACGDAEKFRELANTLDRLQKSISASYLERVYLSEEDLEEMINAETWLTAKECLEYGFCTKVEEKMEVAACLKEDGLLLVNGQEFPLSEYRNAPKFVGLEKPKGEPSLPKGPDEQVLFFMESQIKLNRNGVS